MAENIISRVVFIGYLTASFVIALMYSNIFSRRNIFRQHPLIFITINTAMLVEVSAVLVFLVRPVFPAFEISACIVLFILLSVSGGYYFSVIRPVPADDIMHFSDDLILLVNDNNTVIYANKRACKVLENGNSRIISKPLSMILPDADLSQNILPGDDPPELNINGTVFTLKTRTDIRKNQKIRVLILSDLSRTVRTREKMQAIEKQLAARVKEKTDDLEKSNTVLLQEIDEHKQARQKLQSSLEEKNVLINEVHHRVKNNLQIIVSLLTLQKKYIKDDYTLNVFQTAIDRVRSMSMIHERLYKSNNLSNADFSKYLHDLVIHLHHSYRTGKNKVQYTIDVDNVYLDLNTSITCGLIVNELIVNILKHAFPVSREDRTFGINFSSVKKEDDELGAGFGYLLEIRDNGIGFPAGFDLEKAESYGCKIIRTLVGQLKGKITLHNDNGAVVRIEF